MILNADARCIPLADESVQFAVTSPPYFGLRRYEEGYWTDGDPNCPHSSAGQVPDSKNPNAITSGVRPGSGNTCLRCGAEFVTRQIGIEPTPDEYAEQIVLVMREVRRVLKPNGVVLLNLGDSYASQGGPQVVQTRNPNRAGGSDTQNQGKSRKAIDGLKPKDLMGIPWTCALALRDDGWYLRSDIIWFKPNAMPSSVLDRPTSSHEYIFLLSKSPTYFFDLEAIKEPAVGGASKKTPTRERNVGGRDDGFTTPSGLDGAPGGMRHPRTVWTTEDEQMVAMLEFMTQEHPETARAFLERSGAGDVFRINTKPFGGEHFAAFPVELASRAIMAGTSEKGECPHCGLPWRRVIEKEGGRDWRNDRMIPKGIPGELAGDGPYKRGQSSSPLNDVIVKMTTGWEPTCSCPPHEPVPQVVLDPFNGSGTSGVAAKLLGRKYAGLDISEKYCRMAVARIAGAKFAKRKPVRAEKQMELF